MSSGSVKRKRSRYDTSIRVSRPHIRDEELTPLQRTTHVHRNDDGRLGQSTFATVHPVAQQRGDDSAIANDPGPWEASFFVVLDEALELPAADDNHDKEASNQVYPILYCVFAILTLSLSSHRCRFHPQPQFKNGCKNASHISTNSFVWTGAVATQFVETAGNKLVVIDVEIAQVPGFTVRIVWLSGTAVYLCIEYRFVISITCPGRILSLTSTGRGRTLKTPR
jgi:hypothetical protein